MRRISKRAWEICICIGFEIRREDMQMLSGSKRILRKFMQDITYYRKKEKETDMRRIKGLSMVLAASLLIGSLAPANSAGAVSVQDDKAVWEQGIEQRMAGENGNETESSEEPGTEQPTTEEPTTEQPATEAPDPEETENTNSDYQVSKLSPVKSKVIVIDPGHCKKHPGASANGLREEVVVWDIAKACQDALNKYGDVTVYMTRTSSSCCEALKVGDCLASRNNYAKRLDADFLVSMHINAGSSSGANVLTAYKSGYHDSIRKETQKFGKLVLKKLNKIGVANRGLLLRKSGTGNRYSNGKLADYYSIVRKGVEQNIPSVIIEHGYVTSSSDCKKFFKTAKKRKLLGQTDASAIIEYYGLKQKVISGSIVKENGSSYFKASNGKKVTGWVKNAGAWYYFNKSGKMKTGFLESGENTFYLAPKTGKMVTGWFKKSGNVYLAKGNGTLVKNQVYSDGMHLYLFDSSGKQLFNGMYSVGDETYYVDRKGYVATGVKKVKGKYYLFDTENGQMLYGFQTQDGKNYYANPETGVLSRNKIVTVEGSKYFFGSKGAGKTGLVTYKKNKYYFSKKTGKMATGWVKINKKYYYFSKKTGKMQKSKWIGKYYVNSKGIRTKKK